MPRITLTNNIPLCISILACAVADFMVYYGHIGNIPGRRMQRTPSTAFGTELRRLRIERRLLQQQVADASGIRQGYLSGLETGSKSPPSVEVLELIEHALSLSDEETAILRAAAARSKASSPSRNSVLVDQRQRELHAMLIHCAQSLTDVQQQVLRAVAELKAA